MQNIEVSEVNTLEKVTTLNKLMAYRWLVWGLLILTYIISFFHRLALGVLREELIGKFEISTTTFANISSTYFYVYMLMQIPTGMLADSLGARKTVTMGSIFAGIGSIIFGFAPSVYWVFIGRIFVGLGVSVVFVAILKIQTKWFKESEFATITGITVFIGNMGGILAQTPLAIMVALTSWENVFKGIGVFSLLMAILIYILVRNSPVEMGLPAIDEIEGKKENEINIQPQLTMGESIMSVMKNPRTWPGFIINVGIFGATLCLTGSFGTSYMVDVYGVSKIAATNYMLSAALGMSIGALSLGKISDVVKKRKLPMLIFGTINVICWFIVVFINGGKPPLEILMGLFFILGFTTSAGTASFTIAKEVNHPEVAGVATSIVNMGGFLGGALLPVILGNVIDDFANILPPVELYHKAFIYCFMASLLGYVFIFLIKETNCKNITQVN